jgi:branched-subunit amino acid permease
MPFALLTIGLILLVVSVRGTQNDLFDLLKSDVTGPNNYLYWVLAILAVGAVGYIPRLKPVSNAFLVLIVAVIFLRNGGFFDQFSAAIAATQGDKQNG